MQTTCSEHAHLCVFRSSVNTASSPAKFRIYEATKRNEKKQDEPERKKTKQDKTTQNKT